MPRTMRAGYRRRMCGSGRGDASRASSVRCAHPICRAIKLYSLDPLPPKMMMILRDENDGGVRWRRMDGNEFRQRHKHSV